MRTVLNVMNDCRNDLTAARMTVAAHELRKASYAVADVLAAAISVHAACRAGKEPDLIALADALDAAGVKEARKEALARIGGAA